ncbi:tetratricopeptide repeat protein [Kitasatospora purpeofusca]|uniref:ATP-binding protein n=1 Tax=Kitasatospora purpeofusca TaxID=67352 RepID=UPI00224EA20A|nr:tetratricopeptide repeat protein [Kitasatospora purpeofusca]MCX4684707.1 tetratricopeptide repeat protein [Kitasatospora purpeofusca]
MSAADGAREPRFGTRNSLSGGRIEGSVVQAGEIHHLTVYGGPAEPAAAPALPVPRQLPPTPRRLVGREDDLAALDRELGDPPGADDVTVVVTGPAGVGKTALAAQWLRRLSGRFPDGQLYADLRGHAPGGPADPAEALGGFLRAFGIAPVPGSLAEGAALWRSLAAERRISVLLDNASTAAQVRPLLPGSEHAVVVVTSRRRLTGLGIDGAVFRPVGLLSGDASVQLLAQRVGAERVARERTAAAQVVERCGRLPLAVCLAAARIAARPVQPLAATAEALGQESQGLAALDVEGEAVRHALDASFEVLGADTVRLYGLLGLLPFPVFTLDVVCAVGGLAPGEADRLLDGLIDVHLLEEMEGGFRFHDLVKLHARARAEQVRGLAEGRTAVDRVLDWYLARTTAAEALLSPSHRTLRRDYTVEPGPRAQEFADESAALGWLDAETGRLADTVRWAAALGRPATAWQLVDAMWPLFLRLRPARLWIEAHRIGREAARAAGDRAGELRMLTSGGTGLRNAGAGEEASEWFTEALELAREVGEPLVEADALYGLSQTHRTAGRLAEAADCLRGTAALRESRGYDRGTALARLALGEVLIVAGRPAEAVPVVMEAHRVLTAVPAPYEAARALAFLGQAHVALGAHDEADRCYAEALAEFRAGRARHWEARVLELLGDLARARGDLVGAAARYGESFARYRALVAPDAARVEAALAALAAPPGPPPATD